MPFHLIRARPIGALSVACALAFAALPAPRTLHAGEPSQLPEGPAPPAAGATDVSEYLAGWKALALAQARARAFPMTANQAAYDVHYYRLDLHPNPVSGLLTGSLRALATVTAGPLATLDLDFDSSSMTVDAATSAGAPAAFTHAGNLLTVTLDRAYATGETMDVTVSYHGTPLRTGFGSYSYGLRNGKPYVWTLSEPFGAHLWWPCKDQPDDKADSTDVTVTVPSGMKTASNGLRTVNTDDGTEAVTHWRERHPIATYLVSIASYAYSTWTDWYRPTATDSMPIQFFLFPEDSASTRAVSLKVKDMIAAYAALFDAYPFLDEKYGHAEFQFGGGMENQTCTSLGYFGEYVVAHELGHQWWGDDVTCADFHHIWLNEGFATYCEALWAEATSGASGYFADLDRNKFFGPGTIYVPDVSDVGRIFDSNLSYNKPSWVLHMLRRVLGDDTFFQALRAYRQAHQGGVATTEDFRQACEQVSGRNLTAFFQEWIYGERYPVYQALHSSAPADGGYDVTVDFSQIQLWQKFWMPVDILVHTASGDSTFTVPDSLDHQVFTFRMPDPALSVTVDPGGWILCTVFYETGVESGAAAGAIDLAPPAPNPSPGATALAFTLPRSARTRVFVLDASGRRVVTLTDRVLEAGAQRIHWNKRDARGAPVRPGLYWAVVEQEGARATRKIVVLQ